MPYTIISDDTYRVCSGRDGMCSTVFAVTFPPNAVWHVPDGNTYDRTTFYAGKVLDRLGYDCPVLTPEVVDELTAALVADGLTMLDGRAVPAMEIRQGFSEFIGAYESSSEYPTE